MAEKTASYMERIESGGEKVYDPDSWPEVKVCNCDRLIEAARTLARESQEEADKIDVPVIKAALELLSLHFNRFAELSEE